uniref:Uncharacterized protein n=1 Tax=Setaria italica TaxID=4555 RepID=K4A1Z0_SETIT
MSHHETVRSKSKLRKGVNGLRYPNTAQRALLPSSSNGWFFSSRHSDRSSAAATVTLANLRQLYGDVVETATIARSLLAPVASQLSGDPSGLHSRCVLGYCLGFFREPGDVHADAAVAVCDLMQKAVVVFRDEASVAVALRRQAETSAGLFRPRPLRP